jgi:hypothetical protein
VIDELATVHGPAKPWLFGRKPREQSAGLKRYVGKFEADVTAGTPKSKAGDRFSPGGKALERLMAVCCPDKALRAPDLNP